MINLDRKMILTLVVLAILLTVISQRYNNIMPFLIPIVLAHCDTMDGPVVTDTKQALEKGEVTPVLKWVKREAEAKIRQAFNEALAERKKGAQAKEEADMRFFETLVKIHREGEGAKFEGLKPTGRELEPAVKEADMALEKGSVENLTKLISEDVDSGIRRRFNETLEKKKHKDESVESGREFVAAYVEFVHYVEHLDKIARKEVAGHGEATHKTKGHHEHIR